MAYARQIGEVPGILGRYSLAKLEGKAYRNNVMREAFVSSRSDAFHIFLPTLLML